MENTSFAGTVGKKVKSWKCCIETGKIERDTESLLKRLVKKNQNEQLQTKLTRIKKNKNIYVICKEYEVEEKYIIIFQKVSENMINPLFIMPYPCKKTKECDDIKKLKLGFNSENIIKIIDKL